MLPTGCSKFLFLFLNIWLLSDSQTIAMFFLWKMLLPPICALTQAPNWNSLFWWSKILTILIQLTTTIAISPSIEVFSHNSQPPLPTTHSHHTRPTIAAAITNRHTTATQQPALTKLTRTTYQIHSQSTSHGSPRPSRNSQ